MDAVAYSWRNDWVDVATRPTVCIADRRRCLPTPIHHSSRPGAPHRDASGDSSYDARPACLRLNEYTCSFLALNGQKDRYVLRITTDVRIAEKQAEWTSTSKYKPPPPKCSLWSWSLTFHSENLFSNFHSYDEYFLLKSLYWVNRYCATQKVRTDSKDNAPTDGQPENISLSQPAVDGGG